MATTKDFLNFILEQLSALDGISYRCMIGEYIIYYRERIAAYLCDDRLLVKPVPAALALLPNGSFEPPYPGAKDMLVIDNVDDREFLTKLFNDIYPELPLPSAKKKRQKI